MLERAPQSDGVALGLQVTFFRVRTPIDLEHPQQPSCFAARQLLIAHAAIADPARGSLLHEERIGRVGPGGVSISTDDTSVALDRWAFRRGVLDGASAGSTGYTWHRPCPLVRPDVHRRDPAERDAAGRWRLIAQRPSSGRGQSLLLLAATCARRATDAQWPHRTVQWHRLARSRMVEHTSRSGCGCWDWIGMNVDDGSALMAYSFRRKDTTSRADALFAYASLRDRSGTRTFAPADVAFEPIEHWTSPRTRARYPVAMRIRVGDRVFETRPLMPDQEPRQPTKR